MAPSEKSDKGRDGLAAHVGSSAIRSSSPGGFFSRVGLAQPTLKVTLDEAVHFLHPTPKGEPSDDPVVSGSIMLYLPKARTLEGLTVRLVGRQDINFGDMRASESSISLDKEVTLNIRQNAVLEKGEHRFGFSLIIPSSTACFERCNWGRVKHTVTATAKGLGQLGGDVVSPAVRLALIVNPGGAGASEPPPSYSQHHEGVAEDLGPYSMSLRSQHIMVGGLMLCRFHIFSAPCALIIHSVKVKVTQHFTLVSPSDPTRTSTMPPDTRTVISLGSQQLPNYGKIDQRDRYHSGPLHRLEKGEEYKLHHLGRMPDHDFLRPSTSEWSESAIRVRHDISLEITYQVLEDASSRSKSRERGGKGKEKDDLYKPKKLVVSQPLTLFSCCAFVDSLTLPVYSLDKPELDESPPCLCGYNMKSVTAFHGKSLQAERPDDDEEDERRPFFERRVTAPKLDSAPPTPPAYD
ncbi:hypothetical protein BCR35DRAFT_304079 [Leucosporidium creatinivorum]|uniref:Arrestin-like N-terminal domain-containing protein n=1 Tax=Leucosporidium creatinivorum TaxID=106004 RepID=A0A1Y2FBD2_9BASI|nr:hypothetical protein BCR35DRAFT_304079 [Leucosporidium creatinivorum]